jgi:PAS domain S-box-containing protein
VILRIYRGRVADSDREHFLGQVRERASARLMLPGLLSFQPAWRQAGRGLQVVLPSPWDECVSIATLDRNLDQPITLPGAGKLVHGGHSTHYELVAGSLRSMAIGGARVRILRGDLRPNEDAAFFSWARGRLEALIDDGQLLGAHLGRRIMQHGQEAIHVGIWRNDEVLDELTGGRRDKPIALGEETLKYFTDEWSLEDYEAVSRVPAGRSAPALLLADDQRRYFYATPAAARLTGFSVARLTSMRVEDLALPELAESVESMWQRFLAVGEQEGPFVLVRRDGSRQEVIYHARANTPWPGAHTSLLAPVGANGPLPEFDAALSAAGIVARHATPSGAAGPAAVPRSEGLEVRTG